MFRNVIENVIGAVVCTVLVSCYKKVKKFIHDSDMQQKPDKPDKKEKVYRQFIVSLFTLVISLVILFSLPFTSSGPIVLFKVSLGLFAFIAFTLVWGAFDYALAFYPTDNSLRTDPTNNSSDQTRN